MIRAYRSEDKLEVIELLRKNIPAFFASEEEEDFQQYLEKEREDYFVYNEGLKIIGAGGVNYFPTENEARISWDMIDPEYHGKGIGRKLVRHRLQHIQESAERIDTIIVRTSQVAFRFYEKMGFELKKIEKDFWAEGFDLYLMKMTIPEDL